MPRLHALAGLLALVVAGGEAHAAGSDAGKPARLTRASIDGAAFEPASPIAMPEAPADKPADGKASGKPGKAKGERAKGPDPLIVKVQVLLDKARFSPGAIDGRDGGNLRSALSAFAAAQGLPASRELASEAFDRLQATAGGPVTAEYTLTKADAAGPYAKAIPPKMEQQAKLKALSYASPREMLAERFHVTPELLAALNPGKSFGKAGATILVPAVRPMATATPKASDIQVKDVARIEVEKGTRDVRGFDREGKLVAYYPASIGSEEKPAPSGETKVERVAFNPGYTYNPKYAFKGVKAKTTFSIPAGPNNPVGLVWIDLAIPSYGIHGTPGPEKVGKTESHGCIRLTNWDVRDLGARVEVGAPVLFKD